MIPATRTAVLPLRASILPRATDEQGNYGANATWRLRHWWSAVGPSAERWVSNWHAASWAATWPFGPRTSTTAPAARFCSSNCVPASWRPTAVVFGPWASRREQHVAGRLGRRQWPQCMRYRRRQHSRLYRRGRCGGTAGTRGPVYGLRSPQQQHTSHLAQYASRRGHGLLRRRQRTVRPATALREGRYGISRRAYWRPIPHSLNWQRLQASSDSQLIDGSKF